MNSTEWESYDNYYRFYVNSTFVQKEKRGVEQIVQVGKVYNENPGFCTNSTFVEEEKKGVKSEQYNLVKKR